MEVINLETIPLPDLKPYDVSQLQAEHHCYSPQEAYVQLCQKMQCRPSREVMALLPTQVGAWNNVEYVNLSRTYVGPKGVLPVVELCKRLPQLRCLSLAGNYLQNDTVWCIAQLAAYHPRLSEVDVSNNEFVSWSGAMCLASAAVQNPRITFVNLTGTAVDKESAEAVFRYTRRNAVTMAASQGRNSPNPTSHPTAIHLRAMRRYFDQIKNPSTGCTDREALATGYIERMRSLGLNGETEKCTATFESLKARAPSDEVTWEVFLVLVLLDAVEVVQPYIDSLRKLFIEFNIADSDGGVGGIDDAGGRTTRGASHISVDGFVEANAFSAMFMRLHGSCPSPQDIGSLRSVMNLEGDNTVSWDEFLYIWYCRRPAVGGRMLHSAATQLPRLIRPIHN